MADDGEQWTYSVRAWRPHRVGLVKLGRFAVPREVEVHVTGDATLPVGRRWPQARFRFEVIDGAAVCTEVNISSKPGDRAIRTTDLTVFNLDALAEEAFTRFAETEIAPETYSRKPGGDAAAMPEVHRGVYRGFADSDAELREVARVYLSPGARPKPTDSVMKLLGYGSRATASRKVKEARARGLIPSPGAGAAELDAAYASLMVDLGARQAEIEDVAARREARSWARTHPEAAMQEKADAWQRRQVARAAAEERSQREGDQEDG
ncbi:hypothetical protein [Microbacterium invictum]|uniref:Uncharacterized protein n=1 Tax=Microbacterium invictum TaxID=515415 RepID=A0ABZ0V6V7_9MICO|nr:hypothetical protein [Microbacterium invictum]WQB69021.1 hypothetical protein T9R20_09885 [Microbacterium invictum]